MLLELRFAGLRFHVGVRVAKVTDGVRTDDGRQAAVWGWSYRTLEGHLEAGEMAYEVRKWLDTGEGRVSHPRLLAHGPRSAIR